jgi:hypothetical protein
MSDPVSQIFDRYLDQPATLPTEVRRRVEHACEGEIVQLYALADLDASLRLCHIWVTLTANYLGVTRVVDRRVDESTRVVPRGRLEKVVEQPGLSCTVVHLLERNEEPTLLPPSGTLTGSAVPSGICSTFSTNSSMAGHQSLLQATSVTEKPSSGLSEKRRHVHWRMEL